MENITTLPSEMNRKFVKTFVESTTINRTNSQYGIKLDENKYFLSHHLFILYEIDSGTYLSFELKDNNNVNIYEYVKLDISKSKYKMRQYERRMKQFNFWKQSKNS